MKLEDISECRINNLNIIKFEKWTSKTLSKLQVFLENRKLIKTPCDCDFCNKVGFKNINYAVKMLLCQIPRAIRMIKKSFPTELDKIERLSKNRKRKKSNINIVTRQDMIFFNRLRTFLCNIENEVKDLNRPFQPYLCCVVCDQTRLARFNCVYKYILIVLNLSVLLYISK